MSCGRLSALKTKKKEKQRWIKKKKSAEKKGTYNWIIELYDKNKKGKKRRKIETYLFWCKNGNGFALIIYSQKSKP